MAAAEHTDGDDLAQRRSNEQHQDQHQQYGYDRPPMGSSSSDRGGDDLSWKKGGHVRLGSTDPALSPTKSDDTTTIMMKPDSVRDVELDDRTGAGARTRSADDYPHFGVDALIHEGRPRADGTGVTYKVYKRRWFGLVQLTLLNIIVSWDWLTFAPVASSSAEYFNTSESIVNWLSTAFMFSFCAATPVVIYVLHWGPRPSIVTAAVLVLIGNWVRYGGTRGGTNGTYGVVMFGQILTGLAQPFVLAAPTRYSDLWFTNRGRVAATALMSLANPFGAALGQLIVPFWVTKASEVPNGVLYVSIISSICAIPSFFIPAKPPTPAAPSSETPKMSLHASVKVLTGSLEFWLIFIPFAVYVGFFNSITSLLNQFMEPYGFNDTDSGIAGALLIVVGLVASAITSPILDRTKAFLLAIKIAVPIIAITYLIFIWMPGTRDIAGPYVVLSILGAASFALVPVAVEYLVELTHPVSPEVTSTLGWGGGQLLGGIFIVVSDALRSGEDANPPKNMHKALIFQAVVALAIMPLPMFLGLFGRKDKVRLRRVRSDDLVLGPGAATAA